MKNSKGVNEIGSQDISFYQPSQFELAINNLKAEIGEVKFFNEMSFYVTLCHFISYLLRNLNVHRRDF